MKKTIANYRAKARILVGYLRGTLIRLQAKSSLGKLVILKGCTIYAPFRISFGKNVFINQECLIDPHGEVEIGSNVIIGPRTQIYTVNHNFNRLDIPIRYQGVQNKPVIIEDDVWIAAGCVIIPGVKIGKGSVVAAGSVVVKDVEPYSVIGGNPAKVIKMRKVPYNYVEKMPKRPLLEDPGIYYGNVLI